MGCLLEFKCGQCDSSSRYSITPLEEQGQLAFEIHKKGNDAQKFCFFSYASRFNRVFCYGAGALGFSALFASCIASMLIPAIGSVGVIAFATILRSKFIAKIEDPTPEVIVVNQAFREKLQRCFQQTDEVWSDDDFSEEEFSAIETAQTSAEDEANPVSFLEKFKTFITHNDALDCPSLREALCRSDYQDLFRPRQLLKEILDAYQSIEKVDFVGIKLNRTDLSKYIQGKIEKVAQKLTEGVYLEEPDQEQKEFMRIIHEQADRVQVSGTEDSDKIQLLVKKMTLIGTLYEGLAHYQKLEAGERSYFSDKAKHAYNYAKQFGVQCSGSINLAEQLRQELAQRNQAATL